MAVPVKRLHYFEGEFLREQDFIDEQNYHIQRQRDHNQLLHTPGIAQGLEIPDPPAGSTRVTVNTGIAYDNQGREIVLANNQEINLESFADDRSVYLAISYAEQETDPTSEAGVTGNTRWTEEPLIETLLPDESDQFPADPEEKIILAKVNRSGKEISTIDQTERRAAGVVGGDLEVRSLTLTNPAIVSDQWSHLNLSAAQQVDLDGSLSIDGNLNVTGTIEGNLADSSIGTAELANVSVTLEKLATNSVNADKIINGSVNNYKLSNNSVNADKIINGSVGTAELADGSVTLEKLATNSVNAAKIVNLSVGTNELANGSVTLEKLATNSVNADKIVNLSVGTNELANGSVTLEKLATNSVNAAKIVNGSVGTAKLANGAVNADKLADSMQVQGEGFQRFLYTYTNSLASADQPSPTAYGIQNYAGASTDAAGSEDAFTIANSQGIFSNSQASSTASEYSNASSSGFYSNSTASTAAAGSEDTFTSVNSDGLYAYSQATSTASEYSNASSDGLYSNSRASTSAVGAEQRSTYANSQGLYAYSQATSDASEHSNAQSYGVVGNANASTAAAGTQQRSTYANSYGVVGNANASTDAERSYAYSFGVSGNASATSEQTYAYSYGISGNASATATSEQSYAYSYGVRGTAASSQERSRSCGVYGFANVGESYANSPVYGVWGEGYFYSSAATEVNSPVYGVYSQGIVNNATEVNSPVYGVYGWGIVNNATEVNSSVYGVYGYGYVNATEINSPVYGVYGYAYASEASSKAYGVYASADSNGTPLYVNGKAVITGGVNPSHITDRFINGSGQRLRTGDVVKLKGTPISRFQGENNKVPVPEVTLADRENDSKVIGVVDSEAIPGPEVPDTRVGAEDPTFIEDGGDLYVVILGNYAHCKVDATEAPIDVGDLLTSSNNPGHAKKAIEPKLGSIIGKALEPLEEGRGYIAVFVNIQ